MDLSVLIPARNEAFLRHTVEDVLSHAKADTEIIVVADGAWPIEGLSQHPRVTLIRTPEPIGQRQSVNLSAKLSQATYLMKLDAHCAVDDGFDVKLIDAARTLGDDVTQIPSQWNLHAFDWVCENTTCSYRLDQGPTPESCKKCGGPMRQELVWQHRRKTDAWRFDSLPKFGYWGEYRSRPDVKAQGDIYDVMSSLGACFFMSRDRFWQLGGMDERHGSWGSFGIEIACKSWLSGGRHVVNSRTWFSHMFRTQGGDFGFPYPISGKDQDAARKYSRDLWFNNKWEGQTRPLRWLLDKFWPVPGWTEQERAALPVSLSVVRLDTQAAATLAGPVPKIEWMPVATDELTCFSGAGAVASQDVLARMNESQMTRIAAGGATTDEVVQDAIGACATSGQGAHEPRVEHAMQSELRTGATTSGESKAAVPEAVLVAGPQPTARVVVDGDLGKDAAKRRAVDVTDRKHASILPTKGICYYSDCRGDEAVLSAVRTRIKTVCNGYPVVSATLQPMDFGANVVLPLERGYLSMFKQILAGLEALDTDYAFLVEHDVLYSKEHFAFTPPRDDTFYYNANVWKVDAATGKALHYRCNQTSGLCANRQLLVEHYRTRVAHVEAHGFSRKNGFEPGTRKMRHGGFDDHRYESWMSDVPNVDIRHGQNLTPSRWNREDFRNQKYTEGWTESDRVPGWGVTLDRFPEFLREVAGA